MSSGRDLGVALPDPSTITWLHEHALTGNPTLLLAATLGTGEREVLSLALETSGALVLIDDGRARRIGRRLGIRMTGTVGVLVRATREGHISLLTPILDQLAELGFRLSEEARAMALRHTGET